MHKHWVHTRTLRVHICVLAPACTPTATHACTRHACCGLHGWHMLGPLSQDPLLHPYAHVLSGEARPTDRGKTSSAPPLPACLCVLGVSPLRCVCARVCVTWYASARVSVRVIMCACGHTGICLFASGVWVPFVCPDGLWPNLEQRPWNVCGGSLNVPSPGCEVQGLPAAPTHQGCGSERRWWAGTCLGRDDPFQGVRSTLTNRPDCGHPWWPLQLG